MPLRDQFPEAGESYQEVLCEDGWEMRFTFLAVTLQQSFDMVQQFLQEEGYGNVPIPSTAKDLLLFRNPTRNRQMFLFEDNGYVHNPIKILFPNTPMPPKKRTLTLCIYNENAPNHLLKFHRKLKTP